MTKNMGTADRIFRVLIAIGIAILYVSGIITGGMAILAGVLALVFLATSIVSTCPLYLPFGISTLRKKLAEKSSP
jgi:hypothetical protein